MKITPRYYQNDCVDAIFSYWDKWGSERYPLCVLPTAAGKTIIFCLLKHRLMTGYPKLRILMLAHRQELITQAEKKLALVWPDAPVGVYAAGLDRREVAPITIASRDSIAYVLDDIGIFDLLIVDEAHNIDKKESTRYAKIISALRARNPSLMIIGFSATPFRQGSGYIYGPDELFKEVCYTISITELIEHGYLCPITTKGTDIEATIKTDGIAVTGGDFNTKELENRAKKIGLVRKAVTEWRYYVDLGERKATIFYCITVDHARLVSEYLETLGVYAPVIHADTPKEVREITLQQFEDGDIRQVINVGILTEGYDCPRLDCIVLLRPTRSLRLYIQIVGRGLRLHDDKENTLLLDYGENIDRFGPIDTATPVTRTPCTKVKTCPKCGTVTGFYKRKCPDCNYQYEPQPFKRCEKCDLENAPAAAKCYGCGNVFITHVGEASTGLILAGKAKKNKRYSVTQIDTALMVTKKSGNNYLKVIYVTDEGKAFTRDLYLDSPGMGGEIAAQKWRGMTKRGTPIEISAERAHLLPKAVFRPVKFIYVRENTGYNEIVRVKYDG